jgi:hypothetical protein
MINSLQDINESGENSQKSAIDTTLYSIYLKNIARSSTRMLGLSKQNIS